MSLLAAGKSDARLQAYELITIVHSLNASLAQTADVNPNIVNLDVIEEKVLLLQNSGHACSSICKWLLQPAEVGGNISRLRKCCQPDVQTDKADTPDEPRNQQVRLEELDKMLHSFGNSATSAFGGKRGGGSRGGGGDGDDGGGGGKQPTTASLCNLLRLRRDQVLDVQEETLPEMQLKLWQKLFANALTASAKSSTQSRSGGAMRPRGTNTNGPDGAADKQKGMSKHARLIQAMQNITFEQVRAVIRRTMRLSARVVSYQVVHELWVQCGGDELHASVIDLELFVQFVESETTAYRTMLAEAEEHARQVNIADAMNQDEKATSDRGVSSPGNDSTSAAPATPHMAPAPSPGRRQKPPKSDPQVDLFCKILDQNGDGVITLSELDHMFRSLRRQHAHQTVASAAERLLSRVRKAVNRTDLTLLQWFEIAGAGNKNGGQLTPRELNDSLRRLMSAGDQKPFSEEEVMTLFRWMDPNSSGSLSREEVRDAVDGINPHEGEHIEKSKLYATQRLFDRLDTIVKKRGWKISDLFVRFDVDGSGSLEVQEVRDGLNNILEGNVPPRGKPTSSIPPPTPAPPSASAQHRRARTPSPDKNKGSSGGGGGGGGAVDQRGDSTPAEHLEVLDSEISQLIGFVDDGDGVVTIPHFDGLMRKARKKRSEFRVQLEAQTAWAHIRSAIEDGGQSYEQWAKSLFRNKEDVDEVRDASRVLLGDDGVEAGEGQPVVSARELEAHFKELLQQQQQSSGDRGRTIVCVMRALVEIYGKRSGKGSSMDTNPAWTNSELTSVLRIMSGDEEQAGESLLSDMLLLLGKVATACSRKQENMQALLLRLDSEGLGRVSTETFGHALRHIFVKDFMGLSADDGEKAGADGGPDSASKAAAAAAVAEGQQEREAQKHKDSKIERAKKAAAERRYFVINSSSGPFANAQRELPGYKPPAHTTSGSSGDAMKLPEGGEFEGKDPNSAKAALLFSKDREVQMVWCQLFRCLTKLRMTKRDLYDRVDADHGDSITYDELMEGLEGIDLIKAEVSSADLHTLVCSVFPARSIVHEWGVFEKLMSTYQAEMAPHSFAEWAAMNLLGSRKEVTKLKATNQKLHDQGLVLNQTNENIKKDLVELPQLRKTLAETQKTLASTEVTLAETQERVRNLEEAKEELEGSLRSTTDRLERTAAKLAATEESLLPLRTERDKAVKRYKAQCDHVKDMEERIKRNDAEMKNMEKTKLIPLRKKMAAMEKENKDREDEFARNRAAAAVIKTERSTLLQANSVLEKRVHGLEIANKQVVHQLYGQRISPDAAPAWETRIHELEHAVEQMKEKAQKHIDEKMMMEARFKAKADTIKEEVQAEQKKVTQLEVGLKEKENERKFLELELKGVKNVQEELAQAKKELASEQEGRRSATEALQTKAKELEQLSSSINPDMVAEMKAYQSERASKEQEIENLRRIQEENEAEVDDLRRGLNECAEDLEKESQRTRASENRELQLKAQFQKVLQQLDTDQLQRCARLLHTPMVGGGGMEFDEVDAYNDDEDGVYEEVDDSGVEPRYFGDSISEGANVSGTSYRPGSLSFSRTAEAFSSPPLVAPPPPPPPDLNYSADYAGRS